MRSDLLFETNRFNLSRVEPHFINPCCFGEDAADWLRARLAERGIGASAPAQEDWGWYLGLDYDGEEYFLGIGGNSDETAADPDRGEWRLMLERKRSLWARMTGKDRVAPADDRLLGVLRAILEEEPGIEKVRAEANGVGSGPTAG